MDGPQPPRPGAGAAHRRGPRRHRRSPVRRSFRRRPTAARGFPLPRHSRCSGPQRRPPGRSRSSSTTSRERRSTACSLSTTSASSSTSSSPASLRRSFSRPLDFLNRNRFPAEYLALVLAAAAGMMLMATSMDLIAIFVALELQAICFYVARRLPARTRSPARPALKYLLLGADQHGADAVRHGLPLRPLGLDEPHGYRRLRRHGRRRHAHGPRSRRGPARIRPRLQDGRHPVPDVGAGRLPGRADAGHRVPFGCIKAAGFAVVLRIFVVSMGEGEISSDWSNMFAALAALSMTVGNVAGARSDGHQADARLQLDRAGRHLPHRPRRCRCGRPAAPAGHQRRRLLPRHLRLHEPRRVHRDHRHLSEDRVVRYLELRGHGAAAHPGSRAVSLPASSR